LAVRFSQDRIKSVFQDGSEVEAALGKIRTEPGIGDYDLILSVPFPQIEIVRWHARGSCGDKEHWFTFDNRRLYALQRAATAHWPRRVAVAVQVLYADCGGLMRRKCDSATAGRSVNIGRCLESPTAVWDWQEEVKATSDATENSSAWGKALASLATIAADDNKVAVDALRDATEGHNSLLAMLARHEIPNVQQLSPVLMRALLEKESVGANNEAAAPCPTPSTNTGSDSSDFSSDQEAPKAVCKTARKALQILKAAQHGISGAWKDEGGNAYDVEISGEITWRVRKNGLVGSRLITLSFDAENGLLWWGSKRTHFVDPLQMLSEPQRASWYAAKDKDKLRPTFVWSWRQEWNEAGQKRPPKRSTRNGIRCRG
jgi:hypothetical protein